MLLYEHTHAHARALATSQAADRIQTLHIADLTIERSLEASDTRGSPARVVCSLVHAGV